MKIILAILLLSSLAFASAEDDSNALSQSFNTTPLGRTTHGFVTVSPGAESTFEAEENARRYACTQDRSRCAIKEIAQPNPPKAKSKKSTFNKAVDTLLE